MRLPAFTLIVAKFEVAKAIASGATPAFVATFVLDLMRDADPLNVRTAIALSHEFENASYPGTFAEAVFDILAN